MLRRLWHLIPLSIRERLRTTGPFVAIRRTVAYFRWLGASHDKIYDQSYFDFVERTTRHSADAIAASIVADLKPKSVIDVGCGTGALLDALSQRGVAVRGFERAAAGLQYCQDRGLNVRDFNILKDSAQGEDQADISICMEVGHQLPAENADRLVELLCFLAPIAVFSSEIPGGGDRRVLNEQPHDYWIQKFLGKSYELDGGLTEKWRSAWRDRGTAEWFARNVLIFRRSVE